MCYRPIEELRDKNCKSCRISYHLDNNIEIDFSLEYLGNFYIFFYLFKIQFLVLVTE